MKTYIVIAGKRDVVYTGSWFGSISYCNVTSGQLRIAVMQQENQMEKLLLK